MVPPISVMIKPASGHCNLKCEYCFYRDIMKKRETPCYGQMSEEVLQCVIKKLLAHAEKSCSFAFQGGEPTLVGMAFYEKVLAIQQKYNKNNVRIYNSLQTNGYSLDEQWASFFKRNQFLVGVSLDGGPKIQDLYRKNSTGEGSFYQVMKNIELLKKMGVVFNILSVVTGKSASLIKKTYHFFRKNQLYYLQFIPCLDPLEEEPGNREYSLRPEEFGTFLITLFDLWYIDFCRGQQPYIRQFENYLSILRGRCPEACDMGGNCSIQYVIEADGSVYPCDFYVGDQYRLGNLLKDSIEDIDAERKNKLFIEQSMQKSSECQECRYYKLCRGGCRRTRLDWEGHRQYYCKAYKNFFDARLPQLLKVARIL